MKKIFLTLFLIPIFGFCQNLDSLWGVWNDESQADTNKSNAINVISWDGYLFSKPDTAFILAQQLYDFAKAKGLKKYMAIALNTQGASFQIRGQADSAEMYWKKCYAIFEEIENIKGMAFTLGNFGIIYDDKGDQKTALTYYRKSLKLNESIKYKKGINTALNNIGGIYIQQGDFKNALMHFKKSFELSKEINDKKGMIISLGNIASIYSDQGDKKTALEYHQKSFKMAEEVGNKKRMASSLHNIGSIYSDLGDQKIALEYHKKSLEISDELGDKKGMASTLGNIGNIYTVQGNYILALESYEKSLNIAEEEGYKEEISYALTGIGFIYKNKGEFNKALEYLEKGIKLARESGKLEYVKNSSKALWEVYKSLNNNRKALEMHELFIEIRDSLSNEDLKVDLVRQKYREEQLADSINNAKEKEVQYIEIEKQKAELKVEKNQKYLLYGGISVVLLFSGFLYNRFQVTQKQKLIIEETNEELNQTNEEILAQRDHIEKQKEKVEEAHKEIKDSINYAKRIQNAILPAPSVVKELIPSSLILYIPKDVVAGDFYWLEKSGNTILFAAADCTGHGVPGAMVSVVCHNALNRAVREFKLTEPGLILDKTREIVLDEFSKSEDDVKDGMDIALCVINDNILQYAGANNPLWIIRKNKLHSEGIVTEESIDYINSDSSISTTSINDEFLLLETKADKQPIGKFDKLTPFKTHSFELQKGDSIYIFSDGFADQFGGKEDKKYGSKKFKSFLLSIQHLTMEEQKELLNLEFLTWKGHDEQLDDVCVIGVKV